MSDDGEARLADFGVAAVLTEYPPRSASGSGTVRWMAPELVTTEHPRLTWASDMWAFGCLFIHVRSYLTKALVEALTLRPRFLDYYRATTMAGRKVGKVGK